MAAVRNEFVSEAGKTRRGVQVRGRWLQRPGGAVEELATMTASTRNSLMLMAFAMFAVVLAVGIAR